MKISNSKKQLAKIVSENGGWREGGMFSAQDQDGEVFFYETKPTIGQDAKVWRHSGVLGGDWIACGKAMPNWRQTILSRAEYFHLYPAPDDDGWIEWKGGECPVKRGALVDVKYANGVTNYGVSALTDKTSADHVSGSAGSLLATNWSSGLPMSGIIAYRLHKPEQSIEQMCSGVTEQNKHVHVDAHSTIEQLAADYRAKLAISRQAQEVADSRRAEAEAALDRLYQAGLEIGLDIAIASDDSELEHDLVITDWRDLLVGDEVECTEYDEAHRFGRIEAIDAESQSQRIFVRHDNGSSSWPTKWRFIRRP